MAGREPKYCSECGCTRYVRDKGKCLICGASEPSLMPNGPTTPQCDDKDYYSPRVCKLPIGHEGSHDDPDFPAASVEPEGATQPEEISDARDEGWANGLCAAREACTHEDDIDAIRRLENPDKTCDHGMWLDGECAECSSVPAQAATKDFRQTVAERSARDPEFREALVVERARVREIAEQVATKGVWGLMPAAREIGLDAIAEEENHCWHECASVEPEGAPLDISGLNNLRNDSESISVAPPASSQIATIHVPGTITVNNYGPLVSGPWHARESIGSPGAGFVAGDAPPIPPPPACEYNDLGHCWVCEEDHLRPGVPAQVATKEPHKEEHMEGLLMKYFVLKPAGNDKYAAASRRAMRAYADFIREENVVLSDQLRDWAGREGAESYAASAEGRNEG